MQVNNEQVRQLYPGIKIRKKFSIIDQQQTYLFYLDVQDLKIIDFQCDFTGSENISIKNRANHQRIVSKTVEPRELTLVAQIQLHQGWKLQSTFRFRRRPITKEKQLQYIHPEVSAIQSQKTLVDTVLKKIDIALTPIDEINKHLENSKIKFIDSEFPPEESSIVGYSDKNLIDDTVNHWRRPHDIYDGQYTLIDRMNHNNLVRGKLADNSFFSVVVSLAFINPSLLERLFFKQNQTNPLGIYRLRLCKNGQWQSVTIDDLIPCQPLAKPKFASSTSNQIWISLLQKAYAKLHKRYLNLHDLQVSNVFNDLTGCPTYIEDLQKANIKSIILENFKNKNIVTFYDIQEKQFDQDEFIPLKNYAYPLLSYEEEEGKIYYKVLSHNHEKQEVSQEELLKKFKYVCICYAHNWEQVRIKGKYITAEANKEQNSQQHSISLSRWYYSMDLPQASQVHICLHQEDILIGSNQLFKPYIYCSLLLLEKSQKSILKPLKVMHFSHNRQIQLKTHLNAGIYLIIPFINSESGIKKPPNEEDQINDIFKKLDLLMRRQLKYPDLVPFFKICGQVFDEEVFGQILKNYARGKKGVGLQAFREMWAKNRIYWKDCLDYYEKERLFTLSVHSNIQINILIKNNIGTEYDNKAHCQLISKTGQDLPIPAKYQKLARVKFLKSNCKIIEYMLENKHDRKIEIELDCSQSMGYYFVPKSGKVKVVLDSGQKQFIMKLIPFEKSQAVDLVKHQTISVKAFD